MLVLGSSHASYRLWVRQPTETYLPNGDKYVKERGVSLQFEKGKCFIKDPEVIKAFQESPAMKDLLKSSPNELYVIESSLFEASGEGFKLVDPRNQQSFVCAECGAEFNTKGKLQMHNVGKHVRLKAKAEKAKKSEEALAER